MRKLILCAAPLALLAAGCTTTGLPGSPAEVAAGTRLDEQVALGAELAYAAARTALELAADSGKLRGGAAAVAAQADTRAYTAVQAVRAAYRAGNSADYKAAAAQAQTAVAAMLAAVRGAQSVRV